MELCSIHGATLGPRGDVGQQQYKTNPPLVPVMWKCSTKGGKHEPLMGSELSPGAFFQPWLTRRKHSGKH